MEPISAVVIGLGIGIVRERIYHAADRELGFKESVSFVFKGFTREIEVLYNLVSLKPREQKKVIIIHYDQRCSPEAVCQAVLSKLKGEEDQEEPIKSKVRIEKKSSTRKAKIKGNKDGNRHDKQSEVGRGGQEREGSSDRNRKTSSGSVRSEPPECISGGKEPICSEDGVPGQAIR